MNFDLLIKICMFLDPYYKPGECPRATINNDINPKCERLCQSDYDCSGDLKCCRDSCGMSCQAPRGQFYYLLVEINKHFVIFVVYFRFFLLLLTSACLYFEIFCCLKGWECM